MKRERTRSEFLDFIRFAELREISVVEDKIQQASISKDNPDCSRFSDHMEQFYYDIFGGKDREKKKIIENYSLSNVIKFFAKSRPENKIKKIFLKKDNTYVVKKYFTEGIQYVPEGEVHEYDILGIRPIDIYEVKEAYPLNSFNNSIKVCGYRRANLEKLQIGPDSYYFIVAPYYASFIKTIKKSNDIDSNDVNREQDTVREGAHEEIQSLSESLNISESRTSTHLEESIDLSNSKENRGDNNKKRSPEESENHSKRRKSSDQSSRNLILGRENANSSDMALVSFNQVNEKSQSMSLEVSINGQPSVGTGNSSVFGIRKSNYIESYSLESDSTFEIRPDGLLSGMFTIKNEDMDPYSIRYYCDEKIIREKSYFRNGSVFETPLVVSNDFLECLRDPNNMAKEKRVVKYFYNYVFKKIEVVYKKFAEMQNMGMIGSCVPAIVQLDNTRFTGFLSNTYTVNNQDL